MRELKYHEKKLLRKVALYSWEGEESIHVAKIMRRYMIQNRDDYVSYNKVCGSIKQLAAKLKASLGPEDPFRIAMTDELLDKLHRMGLIDATKSLQKAEETSASAFCRRRLPVIMVRMKMAQTLKVAVTLVEQGQVRVGVTVITDPAFIVTRNMEDFLTWVDSSKIRRTVERYNDKLDDFDLL